jgi:hypothetical protein
MNDFSCCILRMQPLNCSCVHLLGGNIYGNLGLADEI